MSFYLKLLFLTVLCRIVSGKQINVTVMVPGVSAIANLARTMRSLENSYHHEMVNSKRDEEHSKNEGNSKNYVNVLQPAQLELFDEYYGKINLSKCVDSNTNKSDVKCVHDTAHYITYPWSYVFVKPALDVALKEIQQTNGLLDGYEINLNYYDSGDEKGKTSQRRAQIAAVDSMMNDNMAALIGPVNNFAMSRVLTFTAHWDILHLTPGAISTALRLLNEGERFKNSMIRTGPLASQVGKCISAILNYYNWTRTALELFSDDPQERYHYFMGEGIFENLRHDPPGFHLRYERITEYNDENEEASSIQALLGIIELQARVLLISLDKEELQNFLIQAYDYGYNEEYVFIIVDLENKLGPTPWKCIEKNHTLTEHFGMKHLLKSAIIITLQENSSDQYVKFVHSMMNKLERVLGKDINIKLSQSITKEIIDMQMKFYNVKNAEGLFKKNQYPAFFHDSLVTLAYILNNSLSQDLFENNESSEDLSASAWGTPVTQSQFGSASHLLSKIVADHEFQGVTGKLSFDGKGDRKISLATLRYDHKKDEMKVIGSYDGINDTYNEYLDSVWPTGKAPKDIPVCGFDGSKCQADWSIIKTVAIIISFALLGIGAVAYAAIRHDHLKKELESQLWKVSWNEITCNRTPMCFLEGMNDSRGFGDSKILSDTDPSLGEVISYYVPSFSPSVAAKRAIKRKRKWSSNSRKNEKIFDNERKSSTGSLISDKMWGGFTTIGLYKDKTVVLKFSNRKKIDLSRNVLMELKYMRDVSHEHLTRFEGACIEWPHICVLTEYCRKGSLKDILLNEEIRMDWMFRVSLMNDLVKGMSFLHGSAIQYHGNLKSSNCVVDSRFVLKITDYGLQSFRNIPSADDTYRECEKKLWTAPELLRRVTNTPMGSQKADVYSFGIILQEIALRKGPFYVGSVTVTCKEIISRVRGGCRPYFRPMLDTSELSEDICNLMQKCWHEDPNERPDFTLTKKIIERFNRENPGNLVENLLHRMEQYAINLEGLVEERTAAYMEEKRKADELLYQMLPVPVVNRLKRGDPVPAEAFESVTICFTDIVGFTSLSAASNPMQIVDLLNDLYTCFDGIIENYDVYKVETIGDAYMLVSGLPVRNGIRHACEIARTSLHLLKAVSDFKIRHRPGDQLKLRIGIHTGPCCAGVVGLKMPRYCLFGDTVNTASRLESSGLPLAIHVSESTKQLLDKFKSFKLQLRGDIPLKGKGTVTTYWLCGEMASDLQSLDEPEMHL